MSFKKTSVKVKQSCFMLLQLTVMLQSCFMLLQLNACYILFEPHKWPWHGNYKGVSLNNIHAL